MRETRYGELDLTGKLFLLAALLLSIVFLAPDDTLLNHGSFFFQVWQSHWGWWCNWVAVWCSVKIILLSVAMVLLVQVAEYFLYRNDTDSQPTSASLFLLFGATVSAMLLFLFGLYELVKAVL